MKTRVFAMVAIIVSMAVPGCTSNPGPQQSTQPSTTQKTVDVSDASGDNITRDVTIAVDDTLKVTLVANHSTPFWWAPDAKIGDPGVIQQTSHEYVASNTTGGPGTEVWTFKALKAGTTTITNDETNVANRSAGVSRTFKANVTVQ